jgi:hypothetical protein
MTRIGPVPRAVLASCLAVLAALLFGGVGLVVVRSTALTAGAMEPTTGVFEGPVPRAECGPGSRPGAATVAAGSSSNRLSSR